MNIVICALIVGRSLMPEKEDIAAGAAIIGLAILAGIGAAALIKILSDMRKENIEIKEQELRRRIREGDYGRR